MHFSRALGRRGMAWRGVKTRPADAMCRFTSVVGNSSHRLVIRVLPSPKGEKGTPSASVSLLLLYSFRRCIFSLRARARTRANSEKLAEAQRCLAEPGPARLYLPRHKYPRRCRRVQRGWETEEVEMAVEMMKAKRNGEGEGKRRRRTSKTRLTRSPGYLATYRRDIYGIEERREPRGAASK